MTARPRRARHASESARRNGLTVVEPVAREDGQLEPPADRGPLLVSIAHTVELTGCSRSLIYELIATGTLRAVKVGRRTLIPHAELRRWVQSLPPAT
jgi:excisionase family DNA binding protein